MLMPDEHGRILNGWKEIAAYLGRGVRTVQRWEELYRMPVHRVSGTDRSAVTAFSAEIDQWLRQSRVHGSEYVRPTLIVLDEPEHENISNRKLGLEMRKFNVLTAFTLEELRSTARKFDADGFVIDLGIVTENISAVCEDLKREFPKKPVVGVGTEPGEAPVDAFVEFGKVDELCNKVAELVGEPKLIVREEEIAS
jgi:hypothetical protein